jgi:predicted ATPase
MLFCLSHLAWVLWSLGYPDQALQKSQEALDVAQKMSHPFRLAFALNQNARLHQFRREALVTRQKADASIRLSTEWGFPFYVAIANVQRGWALAVQGQADAGIAQLQEGITAFRATGAVHQQTHFLALLGEAYGSAGHTSDGLRVFDEALSLVEHHDERYYEAELHRLKGEVLLTQSVPDASQAEACFHQALAVARRQRAKSWELRAAMSLGRLWQQQGKRHEACELLTAVYSWFTEGFDTVDLRAAKDLLEALA